MSQDLDVHWGMFLGDVIPLDLSMNYCSHQCLFCYSNLNDPDRRANPKQVMNFLQNYQQRNTFTAHLLKEGYPVLVSNRIDPFASSNWFQSLPIFEVTLELGIPISPMTRGGKGVDEYLAIAPPQVWYVSIDTLDDDIARRISPGAPPPSDRLKMIAKAKELGHRFTVGINPCVEEWVVDPEKLCRELASVGVEGVWIQPLHFSNSQLKNMSAKARESMGETVVQRALKRKVPEAIAFCDRTKNAAREAGLEVFDLNQGERSDFFKPYHEVYAKTYPTTQDFVNYCYDSGKKPDQPIYFKEFADFMCDRLPQGVWSIRDHLSAAQVKAFWYKPEHRAIPPKLSYRELFKHIWNIFELQYNPVHSKCFAWAGDWDESGKPGWWRWEDKDGLPIMLFNPDLWEPNQVYKQWSPNRHGSRVAASV